MTTTGNEDEHTQVQAADADKALHHLHEAGKALGVDLDKWRARDTSVSLDVARTALRGLIGKAVDVRVNTALINANQLVFLRDVALTLDERLSEYEQGSLIVSLAVEDPTFGTWEIALRCNVGGASTRIGEDGAIGLCLNSGDIRVAEPSVAPKDLGSHVEVVDNGRPSSAVAVTSVALGSYVERRV